MVKHIVHQHKDRFSNTTLLSLLKFAGSISLIKFSRSPRTVHCNSGVKVLTVILLIRLWSKKTIIVSAGISVGNSVKF